MEPSADRLLPYEPKFPLLALWIVLLVGHGVVFPARLSPQSRLAEPWQMYTSPDYGFSIKYPKNMTFYSGRPDYKAISLLSMIPVCDETTVACFVYNGSDYAGTNLQAAGLSVNVLRDARLEKDCKKADTSWHPAGPAEINGIHFTSGTIGDAGLGSSEGGTTYRTFHEGVCFEIALGIAASSMGSYDPGTIKQFDGRRLETELSQMVHTFKFVGPVKDGPAWSVYHNNMVGGAFEYPEGATVSQPVEYSTQNFYSDEVSDAVSFFDRGLNYTITTKVNLKDESAMERWLKLTGYPPISEARIRSRSRYYTKYEAGFYYYVVGQNTLYILSVSDGKKLPVDPKTAPVFCHFLDSFKAN